MPPNPFSRDPAVTVGVGADTSEFNDQINAATNRLNTFRLAVGAAGAALSALATGALAKGVSAAADFEQAMVEVEKVTSPETAAAMTSEIRAMAETIPLTQSELAQLAADAGRFGIEGTENITAFTESVAKMAEATNLGVEEAGESLARLSTLTNTPVSEIENLGASINSLSNNFATSSDEIVDGMLRSSAALSQMGLNQRQIAALSASMNEVSASARRAGTRLRRVAQEMMNPKKVADLAAALGMTEAEFTRMRDNSPNELLTSMAEAMAAGGEKADALRTSLSTASRQALAGLAQNLSGVQEAQELANTSFEEGTSLQREFEAATDTFNAKLQLLRNRLRNNAIEIGNVLLPGLTRAVESISEWVSSSDNLIGSLSAQEKAWGLVATAIGGAMTALTMFIGGPITAAITAAGALATAFKTDFAGIATATQNVVDVFQSQLFRVLEAFGIEFGGAGDAAAGLGEAVGALESQLRPFLEFVEATLIAGLRGLGDVIIANKAEIQAFASLVQDGIDDAAAAVSSGLERAQEAWAAHGDDVIDTATDTWESVTSTVDDALMFLWRNLLGPTVRRIGRLWRVHGDDLVRDIRDAYNTVSSVIAGVVRPLWRNIIQPTLNTVQAAWDMFGDEITTVTEAAFQTVSILIGGALDGILTTINVALDLLSGDWEGAWNALTGFAERSWGRLMDFLRGPGRAVLGAAASALGDVLTAAFDYVTGTGSNSLFSDVTGVFNSVASWVTQTGKSLVGDAFDVVVDVAKSAWSYFTGTGKNTLLGDIKNAVSGLGGAITQALAGIDFVGILNDMMGLPYKINIPSVTIEGHTIGGGSITIPKIGGSGGATSGWPETLGESTGATSDETAESEQKDQFLDETFGDDDGLSGPVIRLPGRPGLPKLDSGGVVERTGAAVVHAGERVVQAADVDRDSPSDGLTIEQLEIHANSREEGRAAGRAFRTELKRFDI